MYVCVCMCMYVRESKGDLTFLSVHACQKEREGVQCVRERDSEREKNIVREHLHVFLRGKQSVGHVCVGMNVCVCVCFKERGREKMCICVCVNTMVCEYAKKCLSVCVSVLLNTYAYKRVCVSVAMSVCVCA